MKNTFVQFILLILPFGLHAQKYEIDRNQSTIEWSGKAAFNSYTLSGKIGCGESSLKLVNDRLTEVRMVIDMQSLSSDIPKLTQHLRSGDFFAVQDHPTARFAGNEIDYLKADSVAVSGDLEIKGVTKPMRLAGKVTKTGDGQMMVIGQAVVDRTVFGIYYNSPNYFKNLKQNAIADEFKLTFELRFSLSVTDQQ